MGKADRKGHSRWQGQGEQRLSDGRHWAGTGNWEEPHHKGAVKVEAEWESRTCTQQRLWMQAKDHGITW